MYSLYIKYSTSHIKAKKAWFFLALFFLASLIIFIAPKQSVEAKIFTEKKQQEINQNLSSNATNAGLKTDGENSIEEIAGKVVRIVLSFIGIIFIIFIILAGQKWMTASGNEEQIKKAKDQIVALTIGLLVIIVAYLVTNWIFNWMYSFEHKLQQ